MRRIHISSLPGQSHAWLPTDVEASPHMLVFAVCHTPKKDSSDGSIVNCNDISCYVVNLFETLPILPRSFVPRCVWNSWNSRKVPNCGCIFLTGDHPGVSVVPFLIRKYGSGLKPWPSIPEYLGYVSVLLHEDIVFKASCSSGVDGGKSNSSKGLFWGALHLGWWVHCAWQGAFLSKYVYGKWSLPFG